MRNMNQEFVRSFGMWRESRRTVCKGDRIAEAIRQ
jgi:hypothetical protein